MVEFIKNFKKLSKGDVGIAGGKGASLGEMTQAGIPVPPGFVILAQAFDKFLEATDLNVQIQAALDEVIPNETHTIENASEKIKAMIMCEKIPKDLSKLIQQNFKELDAKFVAVRSSATSEDSSTAAWAGQLDSFLNTTQDSLLENVKRCWASLFTPRAIFYRFEKQLHKTPVSVAVVVQKMVNSEQSGIAFSVHPVTQDRNQMIIEAGFGLGEAIVSGQITPDSYVLQKDNLSIVDINVSDQARGLYKARQGGNEWRELGELGKSQVLNEQEIKELGNLVIRIENHYGFPCDIEWAREKSKFYIVQSRPITTLTKSEEKKNVNDLEKFSSLKYHYIHTRFRTPFLTYLFWEGLAKHYNKEFSYEYEMSNYIYLDKELAVDLDVWNSCQTRINEYLKKDKDILLKVMQNAYEIQKDLLNQIPEINKNPTPERLERFFQTSYKFDFCMLFSLLTENNLEQQIRELVNRKFNSQDSVFHILTTPQKTSSTQEKELDILEIANLPENRRESRIQNHLEKFAWLKNSSYNGEFFTKQEVIDSVKSIKNPKKELEDYHLKEKQQKKEFEQYYNQLTKEEKLLVKSLIESIHFRSWRTERAYHNAFKLDKAFRTLAEKFGLDNYKDIFYLTPPEVLELLKNNTNADKDLIEERKKGYVMVTDSDSTRIYSGEHVQKFKERVNVKNEIPEFVSFRRRKLPVIIPPLHYYGQYQKENVGFEFGKEFLIVDNEWYQAYFTKKEFENAGKYLLEKTIANPKEIEQRVKDGEKLGKEWLGVCRKELQPEKLQKDTNEQLISLVSQFLRYYERYSVINVPPWQYMTNHLYEHIKNMVKQKITSEDLLLKITSPNKISYVKHFDLLFLRLLLEIKKKIKNPNNLQKNREIMKKIEKLSNKYFWVPWDYLGPELWDTGYIITRIQTDWHLTPEKIKEHIHEIESYSKKIEGEKENIIEQYKLNKHEVELCRAMGNLAILQDDKKAVTTEAHYYLGNLFKEIGIRTSTNARDFYYFVEPDFEKILIGKKDFSEILKERKKISLVIFTPGSTEFYVGEEAKQMLKKYNLKLPTEAEEEKTDLIKGQTGAPGKVKGVVKILHTSKDMNKLQKGEILVAPMTTPDYVPAMKKASAIVTDEGGITCHASIVSRELSIPCIIGTKIATQVLKDGDLVEVDADSGVVRILKKEKPKENKFFKKFEGKNTLFGIQAIAVEKSNIYTKTPLFVDEYYTSKAKELIVYVYNSDVERVRNYVNSKKGYLKQLYTEAITGFDKFKEKHDIYLKQIDSAKDTSSLKNWIANFIQEASDASWKGFLAEEYAGYDDYWPDYFGISKEDFSILTAPEEVSYTKEYDNELAKIKLGLSKKTTKQLAKQYYWIHGNYNHVNELTEEQIIKQLESLSKEKALQIHKETESYIQEAKTKKTTELKKKIKEKELLEAISSFIVLQDKRKEVLVKTNYLFLRAANKLLDLYKLGEEEKETILYSAFPTWLCNFSKEKLLEESKKASAYFRYQCYGKISYGKEAEEKFKESSEERLNHEELQGKTAYPGIVKGKARLILRGEDFSKFRDGEILVTSMTRPEFVPLMKKSLAIVTDEGGITCHAAIVSRELKIPCVIGTKNATRVLHDGDLIEVDANKGVVRVLKHVS